MSKVHIWYKGGWWMVELPNGELYRLPSWVYGLGDTMTLARVMVDDHHRLHRGFILVGRFVGGCPICGRNREADYHVERKMWQFMEAARMMP